MSSYWARPILLGRPYDGQPGGHQRVRRHSHHRPRSAPRAASPAVPALNGSGSPSLGTTIAGQPAIGGNEKKVAWPAPAVPTILSHGPAQRAKSLLDATISARWCPAHCGSAVGSGSETVRPTIPDRTPSAPLTTGQWLFDGPRLGSLMSPVAADRALPSSHKVSVWSQAQFCLDPDGATADSGCHGSRAIT